MLSNPEQKMFLPGAAEYTGYQVGAIRNWIKLGFLPAYKLGPHKNSKVFVLRKDLDALVSRMSVEGVK